jgi:hypothetical protein
VRAQEVSPHSDNAGIIYAKDPKRRVWAQQFTSILELEAQLNWEEARDPSLHLGQRGFEPEYKRFNYFARVERLME